MNVAAAPVARVQDVMVRETRESVGFIHGAIDKAIAEPRGVLCPEGLISANIELILDLLGWGGIQSVGGAKAIRRLQTRACRREDKLGPRDHSLVNQVGGNHIASKRRTMEGTAGVGADCNTGCLKGIVDRLLQIVVFVAGQLRIRWDQQLAVVRGRIAIALVSA